MLVNKLLM